MQCLLGVVKMGCWTNCRAAGRSSGPQAPMSRARWRGQQGSDAHPPQHRPTHPRTYESAQTLSEWPIYDLEGLLRWGNFVPFSLSFELFDFALYDKRQPPSAGLGISKASLAIRDANIDSNNAVVPSQTRHHNENGLADGRGCSEHGLNNGILRLSYRSGMQKLWRMGECGAAKEKRLRAVQSLGRSMVSEHSGYRTRDEEEVDGNFSTAFLLS